MASVSFDAVPIRALFFSMAMLLAGAAPAAAVSTLVQEAPATGPTDLVLAATATYRALPEEGRVDVEFAYTLDNAGTEVEFPGFFESLPDDAANVAASTAAGADLAVTAFGSADGFTQWFVALATPLGPGAQVEIVLRWSMLDGLGLPVAVVRPGLVSAVLYVPGTVGDPVGELVVEVPDGYLVDGAPVVAGPYEPYELAAVDRARFAETVVELPPTVTIADWSIDGWTDAVSDRAVAAVDSLDRWFGPRDEPFEIRRRLPSSEHPQVDDNLVELIDASATAIDHQLAHAWLASLEVDEEWFIEGLAAAFAGSRADDGSSAVIVPDLAAEIGPDGVRAVVDALREGSISYGGSIELDQPIGPDWRTILDLLTEVGGSTTATVLFAVTVVADDSADLMTQRDAARVDYLALAERAGAWSLPPLLRIPMASWDFEAFRELQPGVSDAIAQRDALANWAADVDLEPRSDARVLFEGATEDLAEVVEAQEAQEAALEAYDEAERVVNGDRGLLARVGLAGHDPDGDLATAAAAWAEGDYDEVVSASHEVAELVEGAVGIGTLRLLVPITIVVAGWQAIRWVGRRRAAPDPEADPDPAA